MKTMNNWLTEYRSIVLSYNILPKTVANRNCYINWIGCNLGTKILKDIKPYEIANLLKLEYKTSQSKAKRLLIEIKNCFREAIIYDWLDKSPAIYLKAQPVTISRQRLSLEDWSTMYSYALTNSVPWVPIMLRLAIVTGQRRADLLKFKYSDIENNLLYVEQQKTGIKLAIPLEITLNATKDSLAKILEDSCEYGVPSNSIIRKNNGHSPCLATLSTVFNELMKASGITKNSSLHECRSLSERLYRAQGLDTMRLLGHKHQNTTDLYNDDRGLTKDDYRIIKI